MGARSDTVRIRNHFRRRDLVIASILNAMPLEPLASAANPAGYFGRICREIISQQLGSGAVGAITKRFCALFPRGRATPARVAQLCEDDLRSAGMSWAKARTLRDLAKKILAGDIRFSGFASASDEEVIAELTRVKGIGRWTAEMFLIFTLGREDVFSMGDLALRKGLARLYGRRANGKKSAEAIIRLWSPYRSYACLALWHRADAE